MATLAELMGDKTRGDGRKFTKPNWLSHEWFEPIFLTKQKAVGMGDWVWHGMMHTGTYESPYADWSTDWQEWTPPKKTKKVVLYRPVFKRKNQEVYRMGVWVSQKTVTSAQYYTIGMNGRQWWDVVSWQEMEVEVEE